MSNISKVPGIKIFEKGNQGTNLGRKDVLVSVCKAGLTTAGAQRWNVAFRFTGEVCEKISTTGFVEAGIVESLKRVYFCEATEGNGYKLSKSSKEGTAKNFTTKCDNYKKWKSYEGGYELLWDDAYFAYYIELREKQTQK